MTQERVEQIAQTATLLGIVSQLYTTRMNKLLGKHSFSLSQFSLLMHCARYQEQLWTVSALAKVMEINQPGVTKIVNKLLERGLLSASKDPNDSRKKQLQITAVGLAELQKVQVEFSPDVSAWFAGWELNSISEFASQLATLQQWLDAHRDEV